MRKLHFVNAKSLNKGIKIFFKTKSRLVTKAEEFYADFKHVLGVNGKCTVKKLRAKHWRNMVLCGKIPDF